MFHAKPRGFDKLKPVKTEEELKAEQVLRDFDAGKYGPKVPPPPETKPEKGHGKDDNDDCLYRDF